MNITQRKSISFAVSSITKEETTPSAIIMPVLDASLIAVEGARRFINNTCVGECVCRPFAKHLIGFLMSVFRDESHPSSLMNDFNFVPHAN